MKFLHRTRGWIWRHVPPRVQEWIVLIILPLLPVVLFFSVPCIVLSLVWGIAWWKTLLGLVALVLLFPVVVVGGFLLALWSERGGV